MSFRDYRAKAEVVPDFNCHCEERSDVAISYEKR